VTNIIVTTSINPPTKALRLFSEKEGWHLIVVGDLKTPHEEYRKINCTYYHPAQQEEEFPELSELIGWNSIQRRNFGFLKALALGADIVATVDDDNVPASTWGQDLLVNQTVSCTTFEAEKVFDPISVTNYPHLWHRGFPIQMLTSRQSISSKSTLKVNIQADFWNGDPDIDAICRMEHMPDCVFDDSPFPFTSNAVSPFNSQNTFLSREVMPHYFMFPEVGRMDDIWASYYVQSLGFRVVYSKASVHQFRNAHDLTVDFEREVLGYTQSYKLIDGLGRDSESIFSFLTPRSGMAFKTYKKIANAM
jgi:hypothetical protein